MPLTPEEEQKFLQGKNLEAILKYEGVSSLNDLPKDRFWVVQKDGTVTTGTPNSDGSYEFTFGPLEESKEA